MHRVFEMLTGQPDLTVLEIKDYITDPKPSGYRSLHALIQAPVHLSDRIEPVIVEVQFRTVAMDFWASLEHKIYYKYQDAVPAAIQQELRAAAATAADLDQRMEHLHRQLHGDGIAHSAEQDAVVPDEVLRKLLALRR
ncbi:GTP pyrophosphokinase [Paenarthrobacter nicotinovorans]|nr:hypothetical protein [Paenarthrobacter nicotinovorans]